VVAGVNGGLIVKAMQHTLTATMLERVSGRCCFEVDWVQCPMVLYFQHNNPQELLTLFK
jgi:hypothetical protein